MRRLLAFACFVYGCLGLVGSLIWYALSMSGDSPPLPEKAWIIETLFLSFGAVLVVTRFQPALPLFWRPVLRVTQLRVQIARWLILTMAANLLGCFLVVVVLRSVGRPIPTSRALAILLSSFALLGNVYIGTYWAYRPENLFSRRVRRIAGNPVLYLVSRSYRRNSHQDAPP